MWKIVGYVVLWGVGSSAAVAVAWTGVSAVDDGIASSAETSDVAAPGPGTTDEPSSRGDGRDDASATVGSSSDVPVDGNESDAIGSNENRSSGAAATGDTRADESTTSTTPRNSASAPGSGQATPRSTTSSNPTTTTRATTSTTRATTSTTTRATTSTTRATTSTTRATTSTTTATTNPPTTNPPAQAQTKTFNLVGGATAISFSASEVRVLWATPNPGFDVDVQREGSGMKVEFRSDDHRSRIDAWWAGGPRHEIREEDD